MERFECTGASINIRENVCNEIKKLESREDECIAYAFTCLI